MNSNSAPHAYLVGIGAGQVTSLTAEAKKIIESATLVCGAKRILESVKNIVHGNTFDSYDSEEILKKFEEEESSKKNALPVAVFSGDTGFFSGCSKLTRLLEEKKWAVHVIPGISSVQYFASRLKKNWQDWKLASAHGTDCNIGVELTFSKSVFFLTGGKISAKTIVRFVNQNEIPAKIFVGSDLGYQTEKITEFSTLDESGGRETFRCARRADRFYRKKLSQHKRRGFFTGRKSSHDKKACSFRNNRFARCKK